MSKRFNFTLSAVLLLLMATRSIQKQDYLWAFFQLTCGSLFTWIAIKLYRQERASRSMIE